MRERDKPSKCNLSNLALLGGEPAFGDPLHVGRPNIGNSNRLLERLEEILDQRWLTNNGPYVREFERSIAKTLSAGHCVAMCNGTVALEIAARALGMQGEVIVPSYTFIATAHCLSWQNITPVFCDIDPITCTIDPNLVEGKITPKTSGILAVHLWGKACEIEELEEISRRRGLSLLFDASHAFGCTYKGKHIGGFGDAEVFSFHATKFINSFEGGAVVTNDGELAEKMRLMRNFGFAGEDRVVYFGTNGKMPEISAAMGLTSLESMDRFIEINRLNYLAYRKGLAGISGVKLRPYLQYPKEENNYQYVVIELDESEYGISRDELMRIIRAENVLARRYFFPGCHRMVPYKEKSPSGGYKLPFTELVSERNLCLPTGTAVRPDDINKICGIIRCVKDNIREVIQLLSGEHQVPM